MLTKLSTHSQLHGRHMCATFGTDKVFAPAMSRGRSAGTLNACRNSAQLNACGRLSKYGAFGQLRKNVKRVGSLTTVCRAVEAEKAESYRTIIQGRNVKLTEAIKTFAEEKLNKALANYGSTIKEVDINLSVSGGHRGKGDEKQKCEITIYTYRLGLVRAEDVEESLYAAIEKVTDIVSRKMRKMKEKAIAKGKWEGSAGPRGHSAYKELPEEVSLSDTEEEIDLDAPAPSFPSEIIRTKVLGLTPTSMDDALEQVEQLGHSFYIFRDKDDKLKVLYKRKVSGYGVIVPQFL